MKILKDLPELIENQIISEETAERIRLYFRAKEKPSANRMFIVFGVLGAILVGLGIILILAHNWDELSMVTKTVLAFLPLVIGQVLCAYTLLRMNESISWRESSAVFLTLSVGACISLISQIYNIPGNISSFMLTWVLLTIPIVYLMKSSITSLLYIIGITYYACETNYFHYPQTENYNYWLLLLLVLPHYYLLFKKKPNSNFTSFHNWLLPLSLCIVLGTLAVEMGNLMFISYMSLFGMFYLIGNSILFTDKKKINNGYKLLGIAGSLILLLILSFDSLWENIRDDNYLMENIIISPEFWTIILITGIAIVLLFFQLKNKSLSEIKPFDFVFIVFLLTYLFSSTSILAVIMINLILLTIGIITIKEGTTKDHLGILNFGLLIITILVICRFFDTDISFVTRGILFILVGFGFFATNYYMIKRRKSNEQ
jgi:uncharacterized membrane protein